MKKSCATTARAPSPVLKKLDPFLPKKGESLAFVGVSQNGKTTEAWHWASVLNPSVGCVAWDSAGQWGKDSPRADIGEKVGPLRRTVTVAEFEADANILLEEVVSLAVTPTDIWADRTIIAEEFVRFCQVLIRRSPRGRRLLVFVEEVNQLMEHAPARRQLTDMAERWGKEGLVPIYVTQRWGHLDNDVRAEIAWLISFHQNKRSDLRLLGIDAGKDFAAAVEELEPYEYRARYLRKALPAELTGE